MMKRLLMIALPVLIVFLAAVAALKMIESRPVVETRPPQIEAPFVRVLEVTQTDWQFKVSAQGTVQPRTETVLVPEVAGKLISVSPSLANGGFFEEGEVLVRIDPTDYELAVISSRAQVAQTQMLLEREKAEREVALKEWNELGRGEASALVKREPQLAEAQAALQAAEASLALAERNLAKTVIHAPFAGRSRRKSADLGQFVSPGTPLATLYSVDVAEIRLPLPDDELAFVNLPMSYRGEGRPQARPRVQLTARFAGNEYHWTGRIVRTEGEIDPQTRVVTAVAQVNNPYGRGRDPDRPPLAVGMFVDGEIEGRRAQDVVRLPRGVLRGENQVLVVDSENRLHFREVTVLRVEDEFVIIGQGLREGEKVALSSLDTVVEGMKVKPLTSDDFGSEIEN